MRVSIPLTTALYCFSTLVPAKKTTNPLGLRSCAGSLSVFVPPRLPYKQSVTSYRDDDDDDDEEDDGGTAGNQRQ